ncbi:hypothetical protein LPJ61_000024 [Coemansia biformis]|uniref:CP-type G domain-containing protein n=1 Tax=Coemansia biformis TaxID=1286918 RepID=A0A9W7YII0_9FUNG|nr:hypothetical protein LPJ61_000024 [Coemansia biformis]
MGRRAKLNPSLGKAIIRKRFEGHRPAENSTELHTADLNDGPSWTRLQSITQQGDLEEFLHTAELAGTEFTAERLNVKIISAGQGNPHLLTKAEEERALERHQANRDRLRVPRRPQWDHATTRDQLHRAERESFMDWRRGLAQLQEQEGLLLTPFERNLEVWRQLWRVLERSHLVVQIVDARNPLVFRSEDLETYVAEMDERKRCLLLVNKADMLTESQRANWADYFESQGIRHLFFSAKESNKELELEREQQGEQQGEQQDEQQGAEAASQEDAKPDSATDEDFEARVRAIALDAEERRTRVLAPTELVSVLMHECPQLADERSGGKLVVGLVGYPNVGKSSTINALVGAKRVNVGAMPGKTKHFQTVHLTSDVVLCDCPGLVFPTFATTKADMVCNGVLPIDQLREFTGPSELIASRFPKWVLEAIYGIAVHIRPVEEGGSGVPSASELLAAYAAARGLFRSGEGNPDESRAARVLLKDYVNGKLIYCHPPPSWSGDAVAFNAEHYDPATIAERTRHLVRPADAGADAEPGAVPVVKHAASDRRNVQRAVRGAATTPRIESLDRSFFGAAAGGPLGAQRHTKSHQIKAGSGFAQSQAAGLAALSHVNDRGEQFAVTGVDAARAAALGATKKHKKKRPGKQRSGAGGVDDDFM